MQVRDVLRSKGQTVATVAPDMTVSELLDQLKKHNVGALVVTGDGRTVRGIVSERDVVRALQSRGSGVLGEPVARIMTSPVTVTSPHESIEGLAQVMTESRIRHVPVIEDGRLAGIVSIGDVVKSRIGQLESERESLIGYIQSSG